MKCSLGICNFLEEISAVAAKSLQSCLTLCDHIDGSPPGSSIPGILQARILEWVAVSFSREGISTLSHSVVFLYFFALITEEGFLTSPCFSLELCIQMGVSFLFSIAFASLLFSAICKASSKNHFTFLHFFFLGMVLITTSCMVSLTSVNNSSGTLSVRSYPSNLFVTSTV